MSTVQQAIEVSAPLHTVYEQLATFESYPRFMTGVERVTQISDDRTHWVMDLDGRRREFDAQITERSLDQRVAWSTTEGPLLAETITLRPVGEARTQIVAQLEADVAQLMPSDRHGQESLDKRLKADLASFKRLIELDDEAAARQIADTGRINVGAGNTAARHAASPAAVAARMRDRNAGPAGRHTTGPRLQTGAAGMGGQMMPAEETWGEGMINEEERGSARDF
ncbi:MAG TPA: SRPBCC family protein [Actinoplanes sp.]|jgi:ribosome-associated toxin RatA of RatAB toxin-antitoxin module